VVADQIRPQQPPHSTPYDVAKAAARKASLNVSARNPNSVQQVRGTSVHPEPDLGDDLSESTVEATEASESFKCACNDTTSSRRQVRIDLRTT
jgi:hypothetical protein